MQILIDIDGVLKGQNDDPIGTGILMIGALSAYNQILFMSSEKEDVIQQWLNINKIVDFDRIIDSSVYLEGENLKERQIKFARSRGSIDLFITNDPTTWAYAFDQGIPSIMFGVPSYTRVEFRPDAPKRFRAWTDIEEAVKKQNTLRTQDARLHRSEGVRFE